MSEPIVDPVIDPNVVVDPVIDPIDPKDGESLITPPADPVVDDPNAKGGNANEAQDGAPETYETFTLPDGVEMDDAARDSFLPVAKQLNLTQEDAQALVNYEAQRVAEYVQTQETDWNNLQTEWRTTTQSDKEIGGAAFDQSVAHAKKFLAAYGNENLIEALNTTGMGNHPELIRALSRAGKAMSEDTLAIGGLSNTPKAPEDVLYPNQSEN